MTQPAKKRPASSLTDRTPPLEWIAAGCGLAVTLGAIGYLTWDGLQTERRPPVIVATAGAIIPTPAGYVVEVHATNRSRATAAAVEVEGTVKGVAGVEERHAVTFDYLPGRGRREGALVFRSDPRTGSLTLVATGHVVP